MIFTPDEGTSSVRRRDGRSRGSKLKTHGPKDINITSHMTRLTTSGDGKMGTVNKAAENERM